MLCYFTYYLLYKTLVNKIKVSINNISKNALIYEKVILGVENELTKFTRFINHGFADTNSIKSETLIYDVCGMAIYQIENRYKNNLPLLLIIGWKVYSMPFNTKENKWFVSIGCRPDLNFPDKKSINKYLEENGNFGSNTKIFEDYSIAIDVLMNSGNNAKLNINIRDIHRH
ncbi:hypothetical protein RclHR1_00080001 [Rhizophagus clarus]|uniref:Uncharacterized protein n=1 Tax=Rhizophagus clarus TaxID=94130 RepID=A0A2Z6RZA3_9GLOM|nr:hypothetical protein RclHR1_00080001 [Rhizophagus clarus]